MKGLYAVFTVTLVAVIVVASARFTLQAQNPPQAAPVKKPAPLGSTPRVGNHPPSEKSPEVVPSIVEILDRPYSIPFATPTRLDEVCTHLRKILRVPVVLDVAALNRRDLRPEDTVELDLEGVRLRTSLKLLLGQLGLTFKVIPEDNLLVITDEEGAEDPLAQVHAELKAIHRDLHQVQESVDDLRDALGLEEGPKMRKPTIIEELPDQPAEKKAAPTQPQSRTRSGI